MPLLAVVQIGDTDWTLKMLPSTMCPHGSTFSFPISVEFCHVRCILVPWEWGQQVPLKRWYVHTKLHVVTSQKTVIFSHRRGDINSNVNWIFTEKGFLLWYKSMQSCDSQPIFWRNISPPSSGSNIGRRSQGEAVSAAWRWRCYVPLKCLLNVAGLHDVLSQKMELIVTVMGILS